MLKWIKNHVWQLFSSCLVLTLFLCVCAFVGMTIYAYWLGQQEEIVTKEVPVTRIVEVEKEAPVEIVKEVVTPTPKLMPTNTPAAPPPAAEEPAAACPPAQKLGPWAPSGVGETFEVTCNETVCAGVHIQLWWPGGSGENWGTKEISVLVPPGLSVEVQNGGGSGWEYSLACSSEEIERQIMADNARRATDTSFSGRVNIDELIETGLVVVRFDRR